MLPSPEPRIGDPVSWIEPGGVATGRVVERLTASQWVSGAGGLGSRVRASEQHPCLLVRPDLHSHLIALRPQQLTKI